MAELAKKGTYVRLQVNVWMDHKNDSVHITSNDSDLPVGGMHMSAKKGTQSDRNLRKLLDKFACGPKESPLVMTGHKNLGDGQLEIEYTTKACMDEEHGYCTKVFVLPGTVRTLAECVCVCHVRKKLDKPSR